MMDIFGFRMPFLKADKQISIVQITVLFFTIVIVLFATVFVIQFNANKIINEKNKAISNYALCMESAEKLHSGTEALTIEARLFVSGKGTEHSYRHRDEIQKDRGGRAVAQLEKSDVDKDAIKALSEGYSFAEELRQREMLAMALVANTYVYNNETMTEELSSFPIPNDYAQLSNDELIKAAEGLVFGIDYIILKEKVSNKIDACIERAKNVHYQQWKDSSVIYQKYRQARNFTQGILFVLMML
ncbi:MAG: hypothetical protein PHE51_06835, partial [Eubacteriales bacterium]|nr:hypothetical protein [Eubacteriales bacterium]